MIPRESWRVMKSLMHSWVSSRSKSSNHRWITCNKKTTIGFIILCFLTPELIGDFYYYFFNKVGEIRLVWLNV